jgi:hypothetical protein
MKKTEQNGKKNRKKKQLRSLLNKNWKNKSKMRKNSLDKKERQQLKLELDQMSSLS